jgi:hypothetical membrane protein
MTTGLTIDRALLFAGIVAGLLFFIVPTIEVFRRTGFDIERHAISMLSLGDGGWIMKTVFIVCGILHSCAGWVSIWIWRVGGSASLHHFS